MTRRKIEYLPLDDVQPDPRNPRRHDSITDVREAVESLGFIEPIVRDERTGQLVAGHGRVQVLATLRESDAKPPDGVTVKAGQWLVPVVTGWASEDDDAAARALVVLNRTAETGGWDETAYLALMEDLAAAEKGLLATGVDEQAMADLRKLVREMEASGPAGGLTDPDEIPVEPPEPFTKEGDLWLLGDHRIVCGDSTSGAVQDVVGHATVDLVFTDPPYGVDYEGKTKEKLRIENDQRTGLDALLRGSFTSALAVCKPGAPWYVAAPSGREHHVFAQALLDMGVWRQTLVWVKDQFVLGHSDYHYRHEPIFYGYAPSDEGRYGRGAQGWHGDHAQDSVWEIPRPRRSAEHPNMKPVELVERALRNSSAPDAVVLDPFGGSGTTLIAAHRTGRVARMVELTPAYVDVICKRWQLFTGQQPTRDGVPHDFTEQT